MFKFIHKIPLRITFIYIVLAGTWILCSDMILLSNQQFLNEQVSFNPHTLKGLFFVFCTGVLLYFLIRRFMKELSESEKQYRMIFDDNPAPVWVYDLYTLDFLAVNRAAVKHYGYSREEFLRMTIKDVRPVEDANLTEEDTVRSDEKGNQVHRLKHRKKNGQLIHVDLTGHMITFRHKRCRLVLARDITDRLRADLEISKLNLSLTTQNDKLREYIHLYSHDIRAPLANIMGLANLMNTDPTFVNTETLAMMNEASNRLDQEIRAMNDLLTEVEKGSPPAR
jgi:PAS domain S-box-containing protein